MKWNSWSWLYCTKGCLLSGGFLVALHLFAVNVWANPNYSMEQFESSPISIAENATRPKVMINSSNDNQLFFKAYNDYSDLNKDSIIETTYTHAIDYYGYYDSYKCYVYDTTDKRFEPISVNTDKYCNVSPASGQWSGNFLNWATMSRIDTIRKILFGGHRRVDTATETVLERTYLPHDAHSWAKYYDGSDLEKLTPFLSGIHYDCDAGDLTFVDGEPTNGPASCQTGGVLDRKKIGITLGNTTDVKADNYGNSEYSEVYTEPPLIKVVKGNYSLWASNERWQITWSSASPIDDNHSASNGNVPADSKIYAYSSSPAYTAGIGEKEYIARVQVCVSGFDSNGVRLIGQERCKLYPGTDGEMGTLASGPDNISGTSDDIPDQDYADNIYKPIGLLQVYGDGKEMDFGMISGSYQKHVSGGDVIQNIGDMQDEIDVAHTGKFLQVAEFAGGPLSNNSPDLGGLINAWSLYRIIGYDIDDGTYNNGDNCTWGKSNFSDVDGPNECRNWGNPFSEIFYQSINYFAKGGVIGTYRSNLSTGIPGLPVPVAYKDPLNEDSSCARLSVVNLNSSIFSYDADELDDASFGPSKVWNSADLPGDKSTTAMTDFIGTGEKIYKDDDGNNKKYYIGEKALKEAGANTDDQLCTEKVVTSFGNIGGLCPEAPRLQGSFRIAGLAYYAHVKDIRPQNDASRRLSGPQVIDTYSVALATAQPVLSVPDPDAPSQTLVTIIPACRNNSLNPAGNCAIVDFKIIKGEVDAATHKSTGSIYVNWEDSEQGGDYDQDMWGILSYELDKTANTIKITTDVRDDSTPYLMGFGYVIGGTNDDGFHAHSGIDGFTRAETVDSGFPDCQAGCTTPQLPSQKTYTLGVAPAFLLKDPLWYASKWGGFIDSNDNNLPDLVTEWDAQNNETGLTGSDGIPDNYFLASNPRELETSLNRVFNAILERTSSGTAAAVVSSNVRGEGAMIQAYYEPLKKDDDKEARWIGTIQALWLDDFGLTRQDCSPPTDLDIYNPATDETCPATPLVCGAPNGRLDDYCVDSVVETYFDDLQNRTRVRIFASDSPDTFTPFSMQGVVKTFTQGPVGNPTASVVMEPNSMQGNAIFDDVNHKLTISPYQIQGTVTAYNDTTGEVTMSVADGAWSGPIGPFNVWQVTTSSGAGIGFSGSSISLEENASLVFTVSPTGPWIVAQDLANGIPGDVLTLKTKALVGDSGEVFDDWIVECLNPVGAQGEINGAGLQMNNSTEDVITIGSVTAGNFIGCTWAKLSTYNMRGTAGHSASNWQVSNLHTLLGRGESNSSISLANSGDISFAVSPNSGWLEPGQSILVANYSSTAYELNEINFIWNGREELYLPGVSDAGLKNNRTYSSNANTGRYIKTWIDDNLDGRVDTGEYKDFEETTITDVNYNFFDVASEAEAKNVVNYVRGVEIPGTRNRLIKYSVNDTDEHVMRLGDIINSTPTVVGSPQEAFNLLYDDLSYTAFRQQYLNRRQVVYVGGNDGLLHAFNGGFYNVVTVDGERLVEYSVAGKKINGDAATPHDLGSELWAYAPKNLLSHLQWLKDPTYARSHVYYIDAKPRVFDANIFPQNDSIHPNGWGTIMVVGMNLGGGQMDVDADTNQNGSFGAGDGITPLRSAYLVFDITYPENEPVLLGEIPIPDASFSTVYPAVIAFRDANATNCNGVACNRWYLQFGTGPNQLSTYVSNQNAKMYLFDLSQLTTSNIALPIASEPVPAGCSVTVLPPTVSPNNYNLITCDTGVAKSFMGTPVVVDWDIDFYADTSYFGLVGDNRSVIDGDTSTDGRVMRFDLNDNITPGSWDRLETFFNPSRPVNAQLVPSVDDLDNKWLFFGTGRYFSANDKLSTAQQYLFGIKDNDSTAVSPISSNTLVDMTDVEVFSDGELQAQKTSLDGTTILTTFEELEEEIDSLANGWKLSLPPIIGDASYPSTRNVNRSSLAGGVLFSSVFQPSENPCEGEGRSRLYGLFYKTGTAYPEPSVFGSTIVTDNGEIRYRSDKFIELGKGFATSPALHSGSGTGSKATKVFTQLSTGDIIQSTAETVESVRTGKTSWSDR